MCIHQHRCVTHLYCISLFSLVLLRFKIIMSRKILLSICYFLVAIGSYSQSKKFKSKEQIVKYFLTQEKMVSHLVGKLPKDSSIRMMDVDNILTIYGIDSFCNHALIIDTSSLAIDTVKNKGIFSIRNWDRNLIILISNKLSDKECYNLYRPMSNKICYITFIKKGRYFYADKIRRGIF